MEHLQRKKIWSNQPHHLLHLLTPTPTKEQSWTRFLQLVLKCTGPYKAETADISHSGHTGMEFEPSSPADRHKPMKEIRRCTLNSSPWRKTRELYFTLPYHVVSVLPELPTARHTLTSVSFSDCLSSWKVLVSKQSYICFEYIYTHPCAFIELLFLSSGKSFSPG